jgi:hypothetical protein
MNIKKLYKVVPHPEDERPGSWAVEILKKPYHGMVVSFGKIELIPDKINDKCTFNYERNLHHVPKHMQKMRFTDTQKETLENLLAQVLGDILDDYLAQTTKE